MPLLDFRCRKCGRSVEKLVNRSQLDPTLCDPNEPNANGIVGCGEHALGREPGIPKTSFELKGRGWARDGY